jgi:hypothetical protein
MADVQPPVQPAIYDVKTGDPAPIPEAGMTDAIASGKYAFAKGTPIPVIHPETGEAGTIPAEKAYEAFKSGYKLQPIDSQMAEYNESQYGGVKGILEAAAIGAAKTHTFGLSSFVNPEWQKKITEQNPTATNVGEFGSMLLPDPIGLMGGVSKAGRALEGVAAKVLPKAESLSGRMASEAISKGTGLAAEGSAYGLGQSISEDALGDHDLLSQHTLANMGHAAIWGGALGSVFGAGMGAIGRDASSIEAKIAAKEMAETAASGSAEDVISKTNLPAKEKTGFIESLQKQKKNASDIVKAGEEIGAPVIPGQTAASEAVQDMSSALSHSPTIAGFELQNQISNGFDAVSNTIKKIFGDGGPIDAYEAGAAIKNHIQDTVDKIYSPIRDMYQDIQNHYGAVELTKNGQKELAERLIDKSKNYGAVGSDERKLIESYADRSLQQTTAKEMDELTKEVGAKRRDAYAARDTSTAKALGEIQEEMRSFQKDQMVARAKEIGGAEGEKLAKKLIDDHRAADKMYADFKDTLSDLATEGRLGKKMKTHGAVEETLDAIPNEKMVDKLFDKKNADGLKRLKERFPETYEVLIQHKKSDLLQRALSSSQGGVVEPDLILKELYGNKSKQGLSKQIKDVMFSPEELKKLDAANLWVKELPRNINPSGTAKGIAYMEAVKNPATAAYLNAKDYGIKSLLKFLSPEQANKTMFMVNAEKQGLNSAKRIKEGISSLLDRSGKAIRPIVGLSAVKLSSMNEYKEKTKKIQQMVNNPAVFHQSVSDATMPLYQYAPNFAGSMQRSMINAASFLNSKIPVNQHNGLFAKEVDPSPYDIAKFNRYYSIVENPSHALKQISDHTLSTETVETLQTVYPKLYNQMKEELFNQVSEDKEAYKLPYQTKMMISKFLGEPIHQSQSPQSIMINQNAYHQSGQMAQTMKQPKSSETGMQKLTIAKRTSLQSNDEV